jgi:hypothetical protein
LVGSLIRELNAIYNLGLGVDPSMDRMTDEPVRNSKPRVLMIGASNVEREALILADRGYEVTVCNKPGWRATHGAATEMAEKVEEALQDIRPNDMVVVQALDNSLYMARTVEGGDLPIRRYPDGEFHVEGDLVLAGKDRQYMVFNIIQPVLRKLLGRNVVFITPGPRYLDGCCDEPEHAPNRLEDVFEADLRKCLAECRKQRSGGQKFRDRAGWLKTTATHSARLAAALEVAEAGSGRGGHGEATEASVGAEASEAAGEATKRNSMPARKISI